MIFDPTITAAGIGAAGAVVVAAISARAHRGTRQEVRDSTAKTEEVRAKTEEVLTQVANDHDTNLREDVDQIQSDLGHLGTLFGTLMIKVDEALRHSREHDAASALILHTWEHRHEQLEERVRRIEPPGA